MNPTLRALLFTQEGYPLLTGATLLLDSLLTGLIIGVVPYTEIDYLTYVSQAKLFLEGERNYSLIDPPGGTGPCVYPAGHLYLYSILAYIAPSPDLLWLSQYIFGAVYLGTLLLVSRIYQLAGAPPFLIPLLALSKRLHSIYVLRLFNDPLGMIFLYGSIYYMCMYRFKLASVLFSLALSVKMNALLFLPGFCLILFQSGGAYITYQNLLVIFFVQILIGLPFIGFSAKDYFSAAFDFSRAFLFKWTVNWRFLGAELFSDPRTAKALLILHVSTLLLFLLFKWTSLSRGISWVTSRWMDGGPLPSARYIAITMATSNLIGITFARSLHYQFYSWYAHQIPLLCWASALWWPLRCVSTV
ncbi:dolichyl-P-Man:Man5GlcNAc2-PP-dolichol alpha-1,3-mannosyltransferase [Malassezia cuniculi]|uniref:Dol-P-Man:Man(5)GlcNAc(2)-PP-Dol alpha-1,3-mannosyltransferase n=1 Tax=Malassezia cuniculi TaxID=948313 RepID=A0AAF0JAP7_9BASI|nr:dolichyl-P-Man:Man5GlcNAc2-PP-dolichol alpha-1,3-mannosyltransferase [Malassezia cuniculi]